MSLADVLRAERTQRAWSQPKVREAPQHLADASGVSQPKVREAPRTVQRAERGAPIAGETLLALAAALDVDVQALVVARQQTVAQAPAVPEVSDPYRRLRFDPERVGWMGLLLALPVLWFLGGVLVYIATGSGALLPPGVSATGHEIRIPSDGWAGFFVGLTGAALLANTFAALVRRDTRLNLALVVLLVAALGALLVLG